MLNTILKPNGCTSAPDFHWRPCCDEHDLDYTGRVSRYAADKALLSCMRRTAQTFFGRNVLSYVYFLAVRFFGARFYGERNKLNRIVDSISKRANNVRGSSVCSEDGKQSNSARSDGNAPMDEQREKY